MQISLLIEHKRFSINKRDYLLQNIISSKIDLVNKNPIPVFDCLDQVTFQKTEDQIAVNFV